MSLKHDSFPVSELFNEMNKTLAKHEPLRKGVIASAKGVFEIRLTNKDGATESWYFDLKEKGEIRKHRLGTPLGHFILSDENFRKLIIGGGNSKQLFTTGELKIHGNLTQTLRMLIALRKVYSRMEWEKKEARTRLKEEVAASLRGKL